MKRFQNRSDVFEFWSLDNSSSKSILDVLETIYLNFRKPIVQRVTVVKFGVYNGGGNCFCGVKVKVGTNTVPTLTLTEQSRKWSTSMSSLPRAVLEGAVAKNQTWVLLIASPVLLKLHHRTTCYQPREQENNNKST